MKIQYTQVSNNLRLLQQKILLVLEMSKGGQVILQMWGSYMKYKNMFRAGLESLRLLLLTDTCSQAKQ